ncbi:MAG: ATP-binding protein [Lachnospiraceae bacterium]
MKQLIFRFTDLFFRARRKYPHTVSTLFTVLILTGFTLISLLVFHLSGSNGIISIVALYSLAIVLIARYTCGYRYSVSASLLVVVCTNYMFTYPYFQLNFVLQGYPVAFLGMLAIGLIISTMTKLLIAQAETLSEREKQLAEAEKERMRANLLRAISHDLRTPLTGIIGNSAAYLENYELLTEDARKELVSSINTDANWLLNMVENLLTVTRIHGEAQTINKSLEPVEEMVSEALQRLAKRYPDSDIQVSVPDEILFVPMDAILIEQVIINLLENAIVHAKSQKNVELLIEADDSNVIFHVKDYGTGIPEELMGMLFDAIDISQKSGTDGYKGRGIGLSICKTIIHAHHGTIYAKNHSEGAEFIFTLPREA